jgi:hypothetical protein
VTFRRCDDVPTIDRLARRDTPIIDSDTVLRPHFCAVAMYTQDVYGGQCCVACVACIPRHATPRHAPAACWKFGWDLFALLMNLMPRVVEEQTEEGWEVTVPENVPTSRLSRSKEWWSASAFSSSCLSGWPT